MSITAAQLQAQVSVTGVTESKTQLNEMSGAVEKTSGGFKSMLGNALSFAAGQAIFMAVGSAVNFLKDQMVDSVKAAIAHQQAMAQTAAVLKSTHDASGETAQSIADLADHLAQLTPFSEDTTEAAENMLLTFTNIGKNVFPQATQTVLDMSQALGQDTKSSAIQLGKALNDPITGITALQRVGVTFTDSQKKLITSLVDTGNTAGAQKVILQELQKEFGGSAEAAGKTFGGQVEILKNRLEDLKIKIGTAVMPILSNLMGFVSSTILPVLESFGGWVQKVWQYLSSFDLGAISYQMKQLGGAIGNILSPLSALGQNAAASGFFTNLKNALSRTLVKAIEDVAGFIGGLANALNGLSKNSAVTGFLSSLETGFKSVSGIVGGTLQADFKTFSGIIKDLGSWWKSTMQPTIEKAMPSFERLGSIIATTVIPALAKIWSVGQQVAREVMPPLIKAFETVAPIVVKVGGFLADNLGQALKFLAPFAVQAAQALGQFAGEIISRVQPIVENIWQTIKIGLDWIKPYWPAIWHAIQDVFTATWDIIKGVIQIAWSIVSNIIKIGLDLFSGNWKAVWNDVKNMFAGIWDGIKSIAQGIWAFVGTPIMNGIHSFQNTWNGIWNNIKGTFSNIWNGITGIAQGAWNGIWGAIRGGINNVIGLIDNFISMVDSIHVNVPGVGNVGFNIPQIPYLASGGLITQSGFAIVGERGPEGLFLPAGAQVVPNNQLQGTMGGQNIIVQPPPIYLDGRLLANGLMPYLANGIRYATGAKF